MSFKLSARSEKSLLGVHPSLVAVVRLAIKSTPIDFVVTEGVRTLDRQKELFSLGATRTMNSRHLTGHAVDLAVLLGSEVRWDWPLYAKLAATVKSAANELGVQIVWGGDWRTFKDGPHFELDRTVYP